MSMSDYSGWKAGINATIPFTPLSVEGYKDMSHGAVRDYYGNNINDYSGNIGVGRAGLVIFLIQSHFTHHQEVFGYIRNK